MCIPRCCECVCCKVRPRTFVWVSGSRGRSALAIPPVILIYINIYMLDATLESHLHPIKNSLVLIANFAIVVGGYA